MSDDWTHTPEWSGYFKREMMLLRHRLCGTEWWATEEQAVRLRRDHRCSAQ